MVYTVTSAVPFLIQLETGSAWSHHPAQSG